MHRSLHRVGLTVLAAAAVAACGGDDPEREVDERAAPMLVGTVATGAALAGADVAITGSDGTAACVGAVSTAADGSYRCTLVEGASAPFVVVVTDPSGGSDPLVAIGVQTPAPDETATVNATPLTTAIVGQLSADDDALAVAADRSLVDASRLGAVKAKVLAQLADVLAELGVPEGFDPFTTPLSAAHGHTAGDAGDQLVDLLRVTRVNGQLFIAPVDKPEAAVPVADAETGAPQKVTPPDAGAADATAGLARIVQALNRCFALPVEGRVLARDDTIPASEGGPAVTDAPADCDGIGDDTVFLHNGFTLGQYLYDRLTDPAMVGATFQAENMLYLPDAGGAHSAVVNFRYRDADGVAGGFITLARRLTEAAGRHGAAGDWLLYGNQQLVHSSVRAGLRRRDQLAPEPGSGTFANAAAGRYETVLDLFVNKDGPGSTGLRAARVKGPGLPPEGVVLTRPDAALCITQTFMNIRRKDGLTDPAAATPSDSRGNLFKLQRTRGVAGEAATQRRPNPNEGNASSSQFPDWAHPLDYGHPAGSADYLDFGQLRAMTTYTFEFFYEGEAAPRHTYDKLMVTQVQPATTGATQQWVALDADARRYLDPADPLAAASASIRLSWTPNPLAQTIASAGLYTVGSGGEVVSQSVTPVAHGSHSVDVQAPVGAGCDSGTQFPPLVADGVSRRQLQLRYRMLDGRFKDSNTMFN